MGLRPRFLPLTPAIQEDALREVETAADHITHVGHVIRGVLGIKWGRKAEKCRRAIDDFQFYLKQAFEDERLAVLAGKGLRSPNGFNRARNFQRPSLQGNMADNPAAIDYEAGRVDRAMPAKRGRPRGKALS